MRRIAPNRTAKTGNPGRAKRPGLVELIEGKVRSIFADVDGAQAIAERGHYAARHVASVVAVAATDEAEAAAAEVMPAATPSTAPRTGGSGGGSQRHGAERSCGNKSKSEFT